MIGGLLAQIAEYNIYILKLKSLLEKVACKRAHGVAGKKMILINLVTCKKRNIKII